MGINEIVLMTIGDFVALWEHGYEVHVNDGHVSEIIPAAE